MNKILEREKTLKKLMNKLRSTSNFDKFSVFSALDENHDG